MDFFERQAAAHRKTKLLIFYFVLAVLGIIATLQIVFSLLLGLSMLDPGLLAIVSGSVILVVTLGSVMKTMELAQGGRVVAAMLGGRPLPPGTTDPDERKLLNIVEEMAIASGVPSPEIFLLPDDTINAFAAGHGPGDTAIGVTEGCIRQLSRDELQGVIAHEFSHILHGDMRLNLRLIGLLNGILALALLGGILMRSSLYMRGGDSRNRDSGWIVMVVIVGGVALYLVGWIGVFFGNLIKAAVSRQREFLADASAVQFTRNPDGIAGALCKIGRFQSRLSSPHAPEASHLFFGNGLADPWLSLFATHPPLEERIRAIAPGFQEGKSTPAAPSSPSAPPPPSASSRPPAFTPEGLLLTAVPAAAVRELHGACSLVYALLLDERPAFRDLQLQGFQVEDSIRAEMLDFFNRRAAIPIDRRLALVDLAIPTLRHLSAAQYDIFRRNVRHLIESDQEIHLFEFTLQKTLLRHLDLYFTNSTGPRIKFSTLAPVLPDAAILLSALAFVGAPGEVARQSSYEAGLLVLQPGTSAPPRETSVDLSRVDAALDRLAQAAPAVKKPLIEACRAVVMHDAIVDPAQYQLIRAIADTLDCPLPPLPPVTS